MWREGFTRERILSDIGAGIIVGIVALPLAIAFAIASGVKPEQGLYTAIIAGVAVSLLGGSRVQIAGPTGAFIVIVYKIVQDYGYDGLAVATLMAGVFLIAMGVARLGSLLKFVPYPLTVGFTSGIALIIFSSQVKDFFGLPLASLPADAAGKWAEYATHVGQVDLTSTAIAVGSLALIVLWPRFTKRIPGSMVAIVLATAVVQVFHLRVDTIGTRFGTVPNMFPTPSLPSLSWNTLTHLVSPAITIAMLGAIESLLSAVVADGMIRSRHRPNTELIAQGVANILSPIFAGIPATGAIARTATNIRNGGRSPISGVVHAIVLLLIMLFFGQWASLIPMPTLAAVLVGVSYSMSEWRSFAKILKSPKSDVAVLLVTFFLTVLVDLTVAIQIGVILSSLLFIRRMSQVSQVNALTRGLEDEGESDAPGAQKLDAPPGVEVFEVYGSLFFGAVDQFNESIRELDRKPKIFILETSTLLAIDASGLRAVEDLAKDFKHHGVAFYIAGLHKQPLFAMAQAGILEIIGEDNLFGSVDEAIEKARAVLKPA
jgi:SulP family sulfate permease